MTPTYFLKMDEIRGDSAEQDHDGEIEIESFSFTETQSYGRIDSGLGGPEEGVDMQDFILIMKVSSATPLLFRACATGTPLQSAILTCRMGRTDVLKWTLSKVIISSYQTRGSSEQDGIAKDQVSLNFASVQVEYTATRADGTVTGTHKAGWDRQKHREA
jgi:type VI secretion system secreted protein Hcp